MYSRWAISKIFRFGHDIKDIHEPLRCVSASNSKKLGGEKLPFAWLIARQPYRSSFFTPSDIYKRWSSLLVRNQSMLNGWKKWTMFLFFDYGWWMKRRWWDVLMQKKKKNTRKKIHSSRKVYSIYLQLVWYISAITNIITTTISHNILNTDINIWPCRAENNIEENNIYETISFIYIYIWPIILMKSRD